MGWFPRVGFLPDLEGRGIRLNRRMKSVLEGDYTDAQIYGAALELWGNPTLAEKRLAEHQTAITSVFEEIDRNNT